MTTETPITRRQDGHVLVVSLNRPDKKNALNLQMYQELAQALTDAASDPNVRVVLLRGEGSSFTSGNDLKDFLSNPPKDETSPVFGFLLGLVRFEKPLVIATRGHAVGIGTTMLLHADLVYAAADSVFKMPFTQLALVPEAGVSWLLPRIVGHTRAAELLLLSEPFTAQSAQSYGIVTEVVTEGDVDDVALSKAHALAALPPASVRASKKLLKDPVRDYLISVIRAEAKVFAERLASPELAEAIGAFFEKRPANFDRFS